MKKALLILIFIAFCLSAWAQHLQEDIIPNSQQQKIELHKQQIKQQHDSLHEVHSKMSNGFQVNNNVQLKSTLNASKRLDSIVSPDSKTIVHFDDAGRLLEHIKHNSDANDTKRVSEYDNNGNRTSYSNYIWDDTLQDWVGETRTEDDYHSNGDLSSHRYYVWSTDTEDWDLRYQKDYDENGNTTLDISVNSLGGGYKRETTYDNNSQTILYTTYELENGQWIPQTEVSYDYDANGQISLRRNYVWENSQWALQTESTYEYTSSDSLTTEIIHTWDNTGTFLESTLIERTYNPDSQITSSYTYKSSTYPTPQWEEYEWQEYTYTADGLLASKTWYEYWIYGKQEYTYNSSNNIATSFSYYKLYLNNGWILDTSKHYEYDSEGRTILSTTNWYDFGDIIWIDRHRSSYDASGNRTLHSYETKNYYWRTEWKYEYTYDQYDNITQYIYSDEDGLDHKYDYTFDYTLEPSQIIHLDDGYMRLDYTKSYYSFGDWYVDHQGIYYYSDLPSNCPTGSITFSTQQEIDDFATNYPGCTQILGNLTIDGNTDTEITFLAGLSQVISMKEI